MNATVPIFEYISLNRTGRQARGTIDADSLPDARQQLRDASAHILSVRAGVSEDRESSGLANLRIEFRRIRSRDVAVAIRQLAMLLHSGMALVPALNALVDQLAGLPLCRVLVSVRDRVNEGMSIAKAFGEHPKVFPDIFVNMVSAGEAAGDLENVIMRLADMSEKRVRLSNKVRAALAYPIFMLIIGTAVVIFLVSFVIPSIAKLFTEMHRSLPLPTQVLLAVSQFLREYLWILAVGALAAWGSVRLWLRTAGGRMTWDRMALKAPLFGDLHLKISVSRFARTLGTLLASGVPILDALEIAKRVMGNAVLAQTLEGVKESVRHGDSISNPLRRSGVFPPIVHHMIGSFEHGGKVEDGLLKIADVYDNEVETTVVALTSLLEPVLILTLGAIVGFIVISLLLPVFEINQAIR